MKNNVLKVKLFALALSLLFLAGLSSCQDGRGDTPAMGFHLKTSPEKTF
ncbi:MAG: hypothetical protein L6Q97_01250 [Thermoanaerobaculia bacterium]|nr:hypothetical protein [Thermoanaerobaculia bacterium]